MSGLPFAISNAETIQKLPSISPRDLLCKCYVTTVYSCSYVQSKREECKNNKVPEMLLLSSINSECRFSCSDSCMIRTENVLTIQLTTTGMVVSNSHSSAVPPLTPKNHLQCRSEDSLLPCSMACGGNKLSAIRIANYNVMYCGTHQ